MEAPHEAPSQGRPWIVLVAAFMAACAGLASLTMGAADWSSGGARLGFRHARPTVLPPKRLASGVPPPQMAKWRKFAAARKCSLEDSDYSQILSDLEPFRQAGGITEASVAAAAAALPAATAVLAISGGRSSDESGTGRRLPWGGVGYYQRLMTEFESDLPDMKLLFNFGDKPRSWVGEMPAEDEAALRGGRLSVQSAWERHGCDAAVGPGMRRLHGLFQKGGAFMGARGPLPVLSGWRVDGCFSDILVPHAWNNKGNLTRLTLHSGCPLSSVPWQNKSDVAYWRGSSTGAHVDSSVPPDVWQAFHRQRLVALSRQHPQALDAAFTHFAQCDPPSCAAMEAHFGLAPFAQPSDLWAHKLLLIVDGNGAAARLGPTLCSGSVAVNAQLFSEFFAFRLQPMRHFIPVRPDYSDLLERLEWARRHDAETRRIAEEAVAFVNSQLREEDLQCYLYRLLLEYGALYRPGNGGGGGGNATAAGGGGQRGGQRAEQQRRPP